MRTSPLPPISMGVCPSTLCRVSGCPISSFHRNQCLACTLWEAYPWDKLPSVVGPKLCLVPAEDKEGSLIRNAKWTWKKRRGS